MTQRNIHTRTQTQIYIYIYTYIYTCTGIVCLQEFRIRSRTRMCTHFYVCGGRITECCRNYKSKHSELLHTCAICMHETKSMFPPIFTLWSRVRSLPMSLVSVESTSRLQFWKYSEAWGNWSACCVANFFLFFFFLPQFHLHTPCPIASSSLVCHGQ